MVRVYENNIFTIPLIQHNTRVVHTTVCIADIFSIVLLRNFILARNYLYSADICLTEFL